MRAIIITFDVRGFLDLVSSMVLQMVGMDEAFCHLGGTRLGVATLALFKWSSVGVIPYLDF